MGATLQINASTSRDRHEIVSRANERLTAAGAWVTDFHQFSNVSVCLSFEVEGRLLPAIEGALDGIGLAISGASLARLRDTAASVDSAAVVSGSLQITFFHNEPDLRIPVPAVPG